MNSMANLLRQFEPEHDAAGRGIDDELGEAIATPRLRRLGAIGETIDVDSLPPLMLLDRRHLDAEVVALRDGAHDPQRAAVEQVLKGERLHLIIDHDTDNRMLHTIPPLFPARITRRNSENYYTKNTFCQ